MNIMIKARLKAKIKLKKLLLRKTMYLILALQKLKKPIGLMSIG